MDVKAEYREAFGEEATENVAEWEQSLLGLEARPGDTEQVNRMFRAIHTLKGSAGFLGFDGLAKVAHALESRLAAVRDAARPPDAGLIAELFDGLDLCRSLVSDLAAGREPTADAGAFLDRLGLSDAPQPAPAAPGTAPAASGPAPASVPTTSGPTDGDGERRIAVGLRIEGKGREAWLRSALVKARLVRVGRIVSTDPSLEELRDSGSRFAYTVVLATEREEAEIRGALVIDLVDVVSVGPAGSTVLAAPATPGAATTAPASAAAAPMRVEEVVRVSVEKLDTLLNLVGELVIQNSGFAVMATELRAEVGRARSVADLEQRTAALARTVKDLQDGIMKARMLPVASVFNRFHRVVRDLAKAGGKAVRLELAGEDTEIDKKVIDRIGEPLVHLVRNAVDHGLESAAERAAVGKPREGLLRLGAYQEGDHICVEVVDDGRGLDRAAIARKAVEKGLIGAEEAAGAAPEQVLSFIFLPGFSTARQVSDISGRGVGMDAVKRAVEDMGGGLRVRSAPGAGTTVTISLPLTMAIVAAMLVEVDDSLFAIPLSAVREVVRPSRDALASVGNRRVLRLRDEVLALVHLGSILRTGRDVASDAEGAARGAEGAARSAEGRPVVVVDYGDRRLGLQVDRIEGTREIVIKSLSRHYREIDGLVGASILGTGRIALIVDVEPLVGRWHGDGTRSTVSAARFSVAEVEATAAPGGPRAEAGASEGADEPVPGPAATKPADGPAVDASAPAEPAPDRAVERMLHSQGTLLEEIHNAGAIQASVSLTELTDAEIRVSFPESRLVPLGEVSELLGGAESAVGGVYVGVTGDLEAGILLVVPLTHLLALDDLLHHRPEGTARRIEDTDTSALSEAANLIAAAFVNAMADTAKLRLGMHVPEISVDMCQAVLDSVLARFDRAGDRVLLTQAEIAWGSRTPMGCELLVFLEPSSLERLVAALQAGV
jgi:two-component system, chemotaxis family, sensor kinase CheA